MNIFDAVFYGKPFHDRELSSVYIYENPIEIENLTLQESEVAEVIWMDYKECLQKVRERSFPTCIYEDEFEMIGTFLKIN